MKISIKVLRMFVVMIVSYLLFLVFVNYVMDTSVSINIYLMSVLGWVLWIYVILSWYNITKEFFSLYTIFISFAIVFNYGQCLMWAFGIHTSKEIGVYSSIPNVYPSSSTAIYKTQLVTLICLLAFHTGVSFITLKNKYKKNKNGLSVYNDDIRDKIILKHICKFTLFISSLCTYYYWINNTIANRMYGYGAFLYNAEVIASRSNIITLISWMFLPSIIGTLLSNDFSKKSCYICYFLFAGYAVICTFGGYRSWIYEFTILLWLHNSNKSINFKKLILYGIILLSIISLATSLTKARQGSISLDSIIQSALGEDNPIVSAFFEMGWMMQIATIIIERPDFTYPFGNSYLLTIPGMITDRIILFFNPSYVGLGGWFSQVYLGLIGWGVGFSIIAESVVNYGIYLSPIWMFIFGLLMGKTIFRLHRSTNVFGRFLTTATCLSLLPMVRNTFTGSMKRWFFSTFSIAVLFTMYKSIVGRSK